MKINNIFKNFSLTIVSNMLNLIISSLVILLIPKLIGVYEYGLWQLFIFYSSYVGLLHLGWIDGIYLRYGGVHFSKLNKSNFKGQFVAFLVSQISIAVLVSLIFFNYAKGDMKYILYSVSSTIVITNTKTFFQFILQMTNKIKEYSVSNISGSFVYAVLVVLAVANDVKDYKPFIISYIVSQFVGLSFSIFFCRRLIINSSFFRVDIKEIFLNISVGFKLVLSNISSLLIVGVIRFGIQKGWDVETFGKISLTLSISNLLMVFIGAISLVLFPVLRRINKDMTKYAYNAIRDLLMPAVFISMFLYFPINYIIPSWLPAYRESLKYLAILFPMIVYQAKFEILSNTFFKVLRMERQLLTVNILTLVFSLIFTTISVYVLHNLNMTMCVIVIVMAIRSTIAELYMRSSLNISFSYEIIIESILILLFIFITLYLPMIFSFPTYLFAVLIYLKIKKNDIFDVIRNIKTI